MKLSEVKKILESIDVIRFELPDGSWVPNHFHITEVGSVTKKFIDCGGVVRTENFISFQLWEGNDVDHRLGSKKLRDIISLSEEKIGLENDEVEIEYQAETIGRYTLDFNGRHFILLAKQTDCLAPDKCIVPKEKVKVSLSSLTSTNKNSCQPGSGCC